MCLASRSVFWRIKKTVDMAPMLRMNLGSHKVVGCKGWERRDQALWGMMAREPEGKLTNPSRWNGLAMRPTVRLGDAVRAAARRGKQP